MDRSFSQPAYYVSVENQQKCNGNCYNRNTRYVQFLNASIYKLKEKMFGEEHHQYVVNLITPQFAGDCVQRPNDERIFDCVCLLNYEIRISAEVENILNNFTIEDLESPKVEFPVIIFLLKHYAKSAPVYISWLLFKYGLLPEEALSENADFSSSSSNVECESSSHSFDIESSFASSEYQNLIVHQVVGDKSLLPYDDELYVRLMNHIMKGECYESHKFSRTYFNHEELAEWLDFLNLCTDFIIKGYLLFSPR